MNSTFNFRQKYKEPAATPSIAAGSALTIASFVLAFYYDGFAQPHSKFIIPLVIIISYLMISNIRYETFPKFSLEGIKEKPFHFVFLLIALLLVLFAYTEGLFYSFVLLIVIGIFRHIYYLIKNRTNWIIFYKKYPH